MTQGHTFNRIVPAHCAKDCKAILHSAPPVARKNEPFIGKGEGFAFFRKFCDTNLKRSLRIFFTGILT